MYFVVYLPALKKNVILPDTWIHDIQNHFEKFVNKSINSSQLYLCYYTTNNAAFVDTCPDKDFQPDFDSNIITEMNDDEFDGCFLGKLKQYKREYIHFNLRSIWTASKI